MWPFHQKKTPKGRNFTDLEDPGIISIIPSAMKRHTKNCELKKNVLSKNQLSSPIWRTSSIWMKILTVSNPFASSKKKTSREPGIPPIPKRDPTLGISEKSSTEKNLPSFGGYDRFVGRENLMSWTCFFFGTSKKNRKKSSHPKSEKNDENRNPR